MTTQGTKLVATEANVIRDCVKRVLAGQSLRSVCQGLNDRAISTVTGTPWNPSVLRRILMSARISGQRYLLPGVLRCSHCGALLVSRPRADGARRYVCAKGPGFSGCNKTTILAETLESYVVDAVLHRLDTPELEAAIRGGPVGAGAVLAVLHHRVTKHPPSRTSCVWYSTTEHDYRAPPGTIRN